MPPRKQLPVQYRNITDRTITPRSFVDQINELLSFVEQTIDSKMKAGEGGVKTLRSVKKRVLLIKKSYPKIVRNKPVRRNYTPTGLTQKRKPSAKLAAFLGSSREISQHEVMTALRAYIFISPDESRPEVLKWEFLNPLVRGARRDLRNPRMKNEILPDETLRKLLNYDGYVKKVREGKVWTRKKDPETAEKMTIVWNDPKLYYWTVAKLISLELEKKQDV